MKQKCCLGSNINKHLSTSTRNETKTKPSIFKQKNNSLRRATFLGFAASAKNVQHVPNMDPAMTAISKNCCRRLPKSDAKNCQKMDTTQMHTNPIWEPTWSKKSVPEWLETGILVNCCFGTFFRMPTGRTPDPPNHEQSRKTQFLCPFF